MDETLTPVHVLVRSPDLSLPSRALTLAPDLTLRRLKLSLLLPQTLALDSVYFSLNGKLLPDSSTLASAGLGGGGGGGVLDLTLRLRLRGGGGDGGATGAESRDCYLNMYATKKPDKVDPNETRLSRWTTCALSGEPLAHPAVVDRLGNLFNKEALIEALLHKKLPKEFKHIRGLKDLIPIHLDSIPGAATDAETKFQCPITGLEFNGKYSFFAVRGCGHVLSAKALKEVKSTSCLVCHKEFSDSDKIVINGSAEEVKLLRAMMEEERGRVKERKEKKAGACLSGTKHAADEKGVVLDNGKKDSNGKRFRALDIAPANATKEVYASIFTSSKKSDFKETFSCRSLPLGRN
uniref:Ubiquitin-like domain-containing protein n=1 Tax=Ananas comosus var. bracteatus TaxID=296719 RepID=A0A6V7PAF4_ANACO|nr:unnamed protein product [Ananas comosus var. bracteatus]